MKKAAVRAILLAAALLSGAVLAVRFAGGRTENVRVEYGESQLFTAADIDAAVREVKRSFRSLSGCRLYSLTYAGDKRSVDELEYWNGVREDKTYCQCIVLQSRFHSPLHGGGAWEANEEYTWSWILARERDKPWVLLSYGYG